VAVSDPVEAAATAVQENMVAVVRDIVNYIQRSGDLRRQNPMIAFDIMYTSQASCDGLPLSD
jgi:hypothetical protein